MQTKATYLGGRPMGVTEQSLPDGTYQGTWGGYEVRVIDKGWLHTFATDIGVKGVNIPCTVTMAGGEASVEVKR